MNRGDLLAYCLAKPGAWADEPWDSDTVVKVDTRIFAFLGSADGQTVGVKCGAGRDDADEWLVRFPDDATVMPYIGRSGWNNLRVGAGIPDEDILGAVDDSYDTVVAKLPKSRRPTRSTPSA